MTKILITGGARSGKSNFAQDLALKLKEPVLFVVTAEPLDAEMAKRIAEHRKSRPPGWITLEVTAHVGEQIHKAIGNTKKVVIIDCITLLISNAFNQFRDVVDEQLDELAIQKLCFSEIDELLVCMITHSSNFIIVTNEVGEGIVPVSKVGRLFRDILGKVNQMLARECDTVYLMVAGIPVKVKPSSSH